MKITAVLVCHNGSRWLPRVLEGLQASTREPDALVVVDTGSTDDSVDLVERALGADVVRLPAETSYATAVRAGLVAQPAGGDPEEWVWLLHDDSAPEARCLAGLVAAASGGAADVAVLGPKLREWPSLKRLLEVGVTLSASGRRETGLETGEYDQGQHDDVDPVLAVNTAGMLVRRDVLESTGLADELPLFGNDLDLGWRLARQGREVRVAPEAVMFHVEAARRGRRPDSIAQRPRRDERAAALFVLLANGSRTGQPWRLVRLLLGGLVRALAHLLLRAPADGRDELAALAEVYGHPGRLRAARRVRRKEATEPSRAVRHLLAPPWMPARHGLDLLVDLGRSLVYVARDTIDRRSATRADRSPLGVRLLRSPTAWSLLLAVLVSLVAGRDLLHGPALHGGALWPAPDGVGHWWSAWAASWHWLGQGSSSPAPPYLLPMALVGSVLLGQPGWVVWLLFVLTVPLTMLGALRFLRRVTGGAWAPVWGAATYALVPVLSGAVGQGRLGTVAGAVLLPWVASAVVGLADTGEDRRRRAIWRTALLVGLVAAFVPLAVPMTAVLLLGASLLGASRLRWTDRLAILVAPILLCVPWLPAVVRAPGALLVEAGRAAAVPVRPEVWHLLAGNSGGPGAAPAWLTLGIPFAALVALVRTDTRPRVLRWWMVALVGAAFVALVSRVTVSLPGVPGDFRAWPGFPLLVLLAALVVAAVTAADGIGAVVAGASFGWRQPVAAIAFLGAVLAPIGGAVWWLGHGDDGPLHRAAVPTVPAYMTELARARHDSAAMVLRGNRVVEYRIARSSADRLGDEGILATTPTDHGLTRALAGLLGSDSREAAPALAAHGVAYVFARPPVSSTVAGAFDASDGFAAASAPNPHSRAWRVVPHSSLSAIDSRGPWWHPWLLAVQLLTVVGVVVLALPSRPPGTNR